MFIVKYHQTSTIEMCPSLQGDQLRKQIGAAAYVECSSKTQEVILFDLPYSLGF